MGIKVVSTRKGFPAIWEEGGGMTNTGFSTIVAGPKGEKLRPVYIRRRGSLACGEHALFIVKPDYHIITAGHHREDFVIAIWRIRKLYKDENGNWQADFEKLYDFDENEWLPEDPPNYLKAAIEAAKDKATDYHCRVPYYYIKEEEE